MTINPSTPEPPVPEVVARAQVRVPRADWVFLLLAVASVAALGYLTWGRPDEAVRRVIVPADRALCAVFAVEFVLRWRTARWRWDFLVRNWYDVVGMIPVANPIVRAFRLLRIVRITVRLSKLVHTAHGSVGDEFTYRVVARFAGVVVTAIKKPLTVAVLDEVIAVLRTGHYARNLASALDENRAEIRQLVLDKLKHDPQVGKLSVLPFHDDVVRAITDVVLRVVLEMLADPRTDELVSDLLRENVDQIRAAVHSDAHTTAG